MNELLERIVTVLDNTEGLCQCDFDEFKGALEYIDGHKILEKRDVLWKSKKSLILDDKEMQETIKNALGRLRKECKFGVPKK